jgi:hypothetical protein
VTVSGARHGQRYGLCRIRSRVLLEPNRALYGDTLVRARNMAVAIAGYRGQVKGFELTSYDEGDLDHTIGPGVVFETTEQDRSVGQS